MSTPQSHLSCDILEITPVFSTTNGGIENVVYNIARFMRKKQIKVDIAIVNSTFKAFSQYSLEDITIYQIPLLGNTFFGFAPQLHQLSKNYDIVHVHDPHLMTLSYNAIFFGKKRLFISTHGGFMHTSHWMIFKRMHRKILTSWILNRYDYVLASSKVDNTYFKKYTDKIVDCGNGIDYDKFKSVYQKNASIDSEQYKTQWIYWGRLSKNKRLDNVLSLIEIIKRKLHIQVKLTICSSWDYEHLLSTLKSMADTLGIAEQVQFRMDVDNVQLLDLLKANGVLITASEYEGFGIGILEAMAAGKMVICRNLSPMKDYIDQSDSGVYLDFDDGAKDFAILKNFFDLDAIQIKGKMESASQYASQYAWEKVIENYYNLYFSA